MKAKRIAIFGNTHQEKKSAKVFRVLELLRAYGAEVIIEKEFYEFLVGRSANGIESGAQNLSDIPSFAGVDFDADMVISMGGDGTLLKAAHYVGSKQIPIAGVNIGRLGFLAGVNSDDIDDAVVELVEGRYQMEEHTVIRVEAQGHEFETCPNALNDIAVLKRDTASMITIRAEVNGEQLVTYQADGLIVSTPTGSTAYSLSNGGPIIAPRSGILCLTPVAPHSLNIRPIVLGDDVEIALTVESRSHNFLIAVDGRSEKCEQGTRLIIRKAPYTVNIIKRIGTEYFTTLREKMGWGMDARSIKGKKVKK